VNLVREAAGFEGLIVLAVIYFVLNLLSKASQKQGRSTQPPAHAPDEPTPTQEEALSLETILREIERVKKEKAAEHRTLPGPGHAPPQPKRPTPPPMRRPEPAPAKGRMASPRRMPPPVTEGGPMGRQAKQGLESHEEIGDRTTFDERSLEVPERLEVLDESRFRPLSTLDHDDQAEAIVQRRIKAAEDRNRAHTAQDHRDFHDQLASEEIGAAPAAATKAAAAKALSRSARLRSAMIWKEILGPPKALDDWGTGLRD